MMPYIINVGLIVTGCLAFYKLFLQKETFYRLNRSVLLVCLIASFALPLAPIPSGWSFRNAKEENVSAANASLVRELTHQVIRERLAAEQPAVQPEATSPLSHQATVVSSDPSISLSQVLKALVWLYWFGVAILSLN